MITSLGARIFMWCYIIIAGIGLGFAFSIATSTSATVVLILGMVIFCTFVANDARKVSVDEKKY